MIRNDIPLDQSRIGSCQQPEESRVEAAVRDQFHPTAAPEQGHHQRRRDLAGYVRFPQKKMASSWNQEFHTVAATDA